MSLSDEHSSLEALARGISDHHDRAVRSIQEDIVEVSSHLSCRAAECCEFIAGHFRQSLREYAHLNLSRKLLWTVLLAAAAGCGKVSSEWTVGRSTLKMTWGWGGTSLAYSVEWGGFADLFGKGLVNLQLIVSLVQFLLVNARDILDHRLGVVLLVADIDPQ